MIIRTCILSIADIYRNMSKTVLLVEDFADTRSFMKILLECNGYKVIEAENGKEAVESAQHNNPDIILMDLSLPVMDGITATEIIRKFDGCETIPIIAVTAHSDSYFKKAMAAGCSDVLAKPLDINYFETMLNHYLPH